jgi:hypothetical protein
LDEPRCDALSKIIVVSSCCRRRGPKPLSIDAVKVGARSSGIIAPGCLIKGTDNSSTNTPGETFVLFDLSSLI